MPFFNDHNPISVSVIDRTVDGFEQTCSVKNEPRSGRPKPLHLRKSLLKVLLHLQNNCHTSRRKIGQHVNLSQSSVLKVMKLHPYHLYKINVVQAHSENDFDHRVEFCDAIMHWYSNNQGSEKLLSYCSWIITTCFKKKPLQTTFQK